MYGTPGLEGPQGEGWTRPANPPNDNDRTWAAVAHGGSFITAWVALGVFAPLGVLVLRGNRSPFVRQHAIESLNFQLNALVWIAVSLVLAFVLIGFALLLVVGVWYFFFVIVATARASMGRTYRYPLILRVMH